MAPTNELHIEDEEATVASPLSSSSASSQDKGKSPAQESMPSPNSVAFPTTQAPARKDKGKGRAIDSPQASSALPSPPGPSQTTSSFNGQSQEDGRGNGEPTEPNEFPFRLDGPFSSPPRQRQSSLTSPEERPPTSPVTFRSGIDIQAPAPRYHKRDSFAAMSGRRASLARSGHSRGGSSLGTPYDFFGSSSLASTAPTSIESSSPYQAKQSQWASSSFAWPAAESATESNDAAAISNNTAPRRSRSVSTQSDRASRPVPPLEQLELARSLSHDQALPPPPSPPPFPRERSRDYGEELPDYASRDDLPRYSDVSQAPRRERFKQAVAARATNSRLVPSRIAARLSLAANESTAVPATTATPPVAPRRRMNRSDSAPEVFGRNTRPTTVRSTMTRQGRPQAWTASQYISGARMGPAPARPSTRPSTARTTTTPSTGDGRNLFASLRERASAVRSAGASAASSRRNSAFGAHAQVPTNRRPVHGLGISPPSTPRNRSGDVTPSRLSRHARNLFQRGDSSFRASLSEALARVRRETGGDQSPDVAGTPERGSPILSSSQDRPAPHTTTISSRQAPREPALLRAALRSPSPSAAVMASSSSSFPEHVDTFNTMLPREVRLQVCKLLVDSYVKDHIDQLESGVYRGSVARSTARVGYERGVQELIRLARVNKAFMSLVTDGQLWQRLDFNSLPAFGISSIMRIVEATGPFVQSLDLSGMTSITSEKVIELSRHLSSGESCKTSLQRLSVSGLRQLSERAIHHLIRRSPQLRFLDLSNLPSVSYTTMDLLRDSCKELRELDVSRCFGLQANIFRCWNRAGRAPWRSMRVLRAVSLDFPDPEVAALEMEALARQLANLETLDLSYAQGLSDSCIAHFTDHEGPTDSAYHEEGVPYSVVGGEQRPWTELTARQAGARVSQWGPDESYYRAVFANLKHLNLSYTGITDRACDSLAFGALPALETLQLAGNPRIRDGGLISLLESYPSIRKLDLEGLTEITNATALALTPLDKDATTPGHALTHLLLSGVLGIDSTTILNLIKRCDRLYHVELDDTRVSDAVSHSCLSLLRQRAAIAEFEAATSLARSHGKLHVADPPCAYLSVIDCRRLTRQACNAMLASGRVRARVGQRSPAFNSFEYGDPEGSSPACTTTLGLCEQTRNMLADECNTERVCVKSFWYWQALDRKEREIKRLHAKKFKGGAVNANRMAQSALHSLGITRRGGMGPREGGSGATTTNVGLAASYVAGASAAAANAIAANAAASTSAAAAAGNSNGHTSTSAAATQTPTPAGTPPGPSTPSRWSRIAHSLFVLPDFEDDDDRRQAPPGHALIGGDDDDDDVAGRNICAIM